MLNGIVGQPIALLLICEREEGQDEHWVIHGVVEQNADSYVLRRAESNQPFPLDPAWFERLRPVTDSLRSVFGDAEHFIPLTVGPLPEGADPAEFIVTGLRLE